MDESRRSSTRMAIIGGVVAVVIVVLVVIVATRSDDSTTAATTSTSGLTDIQSPATVTGITGVTGAGDVASVTVANADGSGTPTTATAAYVMSRALMETGTFDCTNPGIWTPFAGVDVRVRVAEPAAGSTCGDTILELPAGYCSTAPCSEVPADWRAELQAAVSPQSLTLLIAPSDANTGQFVCIKDFVTQPKQIRPLATPIEDACAQTSDSVEIPYVPPDTSDIYVPPETIDLPAG